MERPERQNAATGLLPQPGGFEGLSLVKVRVSEYRRARRYLPGPSQPQSPLSRPVRSRESGQGTVGVT
jgi:hypothetical protein